MEEEAEAYLPQEEERDQGIFAGMQIPLRGQSQEKEYVTTPPPVSDLSIYDLLDEHGVTNYGSDRWTALPIFCPCSSPHCFPSCCWWAL